MSLPDFMCRRWRRLTFPAFAEGRRAVLRMSRVISAFTFVLQILKYLTYLVRDSSDATLLNECPLQLMTGTLSSAGHQEGGVDAVRQNREAIFQLLDRARSAALQLLYTRYGLECENGQMGISAQMQERNWTVQAASRSHHPLVFALAALRP